MYPVAEHYLTTMVIAVASATAKSPISIETGSSPKSAPLDKGPGPAKYLLPGTTGTNNHDPTRSRSPAYSMGMKHAQFSTLRTDSSASGPVYFVAPCMTRKGKYVAPAFSMRGKSRELPPASSPGPAAYNTEKVPPPHSPAYSFGLPVYHSGADPRSQTPAPNAYVLPHLIGTVTQVKAASPAYSIAGRRISGSFHDDLHKSPGPAAYNTVDITVTRAKSPSCPATYQAEQVTVVHKDAPAYSFGVRHSEFITPVLDMVV
ncbi:hypothetical protein EMCRGX_G025554 [Ephydatia muelleri]